MFSYWIFTFVLFCIGFGVSLYLVTAKNKTDDVFEVFGTIVLLYLAFSLVFSVVAGENVLLSETNYTVEQSVMSLRDSAYTGQDLEIGGNILFFYGKSSTENGIIYHCMAGDDVEGYLIKSLDASTTYLLFSDNPKIVKVYEKEVYKNKGNWLFGEFFKFNQEEFDRNIHIKTELYVPKSSVEIDYNIDMR